MFALCSLNLSRPKSIGPKCKFDLLNAYKSYQMWINTVCELSCQMSNQSDIIIPHFKQIWRRILHPPHPKRVCALNSGNIENSVHAVGTLPCKIIQKELRKMWIDKYSPYSWMGWKAQHHRQCLLAVLP